MDDQFPPGLKWQLAFDNVVVVRESIIEVLKTLGEAIALVILVMFLFLQNWRSTLIPAITIPVSLVGTFAFVKLLGYSINTLTLFGIVLATGIVVDDAIVVIENIERHMRESGKSAHDAAVDAMREVFSAVVVIGIVLVAVFLPVAFFPGTTGRMYQQFAMTITFAVILSVFNAVTFTPALSALLLDKETHAHGRFFTGVNRVIDGGTNVYVRAVSGALRWKWAMALVFVAVAGCDVVGLSGGARCVRAGRGRRLLHHHRAGPVRRVDRIHHEHHEGRRADLLQAAGDRRSLLGCRLQLQRRSVEQRPDVRAAEGVRRTRGRRALARRSAESTARPGVRHSRRNGHSGRAAVDSRRLLVRRIPDGDSRPRRRRDHRACRRHPAGGGRRQPIGTRGRIVLVSSRRTIRSSSSRSIATRRDRSACPFAR